MLKSHQYLLGIFLQICLFYPFQVKAQLTPDNSLGSQNSVVNPINPSKDTIDGGVTRGINLFHSFKDFNVGEGREVYFTNPTGIENILTRVTGRNVSNIFGKLGVSGAANLFLINPNGIIFGANASLDIRGSFLATTADAIKLGDKGLFSATNPQESNLLSIQPGALFTNALRNNIAEIQVNQSNLQIDPGQDLTLDSNSIKIDGGKLTALKGNINISVKNLAITNGGILDVRTNNTGNAGNININATDTVSFDNKSFANSTVDNLGIGNGGHINITAKSLFVTNGSQLDASTKGQGNAGNININATDIVSFKDIKDVLSGAFTTVGRNGYANNAQVVGDGGDITINTGSLFLSNISILNASTFGKGNSGNINIKATDTVSFDFSFAVTSINENAVGNGGDINIQARSVAFANNAQLYLNPVGKGNAGNVNITATDQVSFDKSIINNFVTPSGIGNAGNININADSLLLTNKSQFISSTQGQGNGGIINITANNTVALENGSFVNSIVDRNAVGNGGGIDIKTASLSLSNGSQLNSSTLGQGSAGKVNINATNTISFDGVNSQGTASGAFSAVDTSGKGNGSEINITGKSFTISNGAELITSTKGQGNGGIINIIATDNVAFDGVDTTRKPTRISTGVASSAIGKGGDINITSNSFTITNGAELISSTSGQGNAGNLNINARDIVSIDQSVARTTVENSAVGSGGKMKISGDRLFLSNGSELSAITLGQGQAGSIIVKANTLEATSGSRLTTNTASKFNAGTISLLAANNIILSGNKTGLFANSENSGAAGDITINTPNLTVTDAASISASTNKDGIGGNIAILANTLTANNGAQFLTTTSGTAKAGNINLQIRDRITLDGTKTGLFANTETGSTGDGGNITIDPATFMIKNGAGIGVNSQGSGKGGNISLQAGTLTLDNQAFISAATASSQGGEITLQINDLLLMRHDSNITATAGTDFAGGNGGNITINSPFIVAVAQENSDITANAYSGNGGNVNISTQGIFGIGFQTQATQQSGITASSEFGISGNVIISTPEVDPSKGLVQLPTNVADASGKINNSCNPGSKQQSSSFTITGRGGLPDNPYESLQADSIVKKWVIVDDDKNMTNNTSNINKISNHPPEAIVEAQGLLRGENGEIYLVAQAPEVTPHSPTLTPVACSSF